MPSNRNTRGSRDSLEDEDRGHFGALPGFPGESNEVIEFEGDGPAVSGRRKKALKKPKAGGFEAMGLLPGLLRGVKNKGYQMPTPVQRKTLPLALAGHDLVVMARTGSGKTAAFLVPLLQRLKSRNPLSGARGVVLSPSRELALQSFKFTRELSKYMDLVTAVLVGGDAMEVQFEQLSNCPDVIIATPGRLMHHLMEVETFNLKSVQVLVFDEADRLFELGFADQLKQIMKAVPDSRQTMLVSATMPSMLAEFARAGLLEPQIIRLDTETRISPELKLVMLLTRAEEKVASLVHLVKEVISASEQTIVFAATKHHVEYLGGLMADQGVKAAMVYGEMDQAARTINVAKFRARRASVLLVTDVAARGIDIPLLDNVINFDFPPRPKLFVHRVGRAARAGRAGTAYSLMVREELGFVLDLCLFLTRPLVLAGSKEEEKMRTQAEDRLDGRGGEEEKVVLGTFPQPLVDAEVERVKEVQESSAELAALSKVCANAFRRYLQTRPGASTESVRRGHELARPGVHPLLQQTTVSGLNHTQEFMDFAAKLKNFRPAHTVLEAEVSGSRQNAGAAKFLKGVSVGNAVMQEKRKIHETKIADTLKAAENRSVAQQLKAGLTAADDDQSEDDSEDEMTAAVIPAAASSGGGAFTITSGGRFRDPEFFVQSAPSARNDESDLAVHSGGRGGSGLEAAVMDLTPEDADGIKKMRQNIKWDKKKKAYVKVTENSESEKRRNQKAAGVKMGKKSFETGALYKQWSKKTHRVIGGSGNADGPDGRGRGRGFADKRSGQGGGYENYFRKFKHTRGANDGSDADAGGKPRHGGSSELKSADQIRKQRKVALKTKGGGGGNKDGGGSGRGGDGPGSRGGGKFGGKNGGRAGGGNGKGGKGGAGSKRKSSFSGSGNSRGGKKARN